jgi:4'-phosphopantetheinyl transferase
MQAEGPPYGYGQVVDYFLPAGAAESRAGARLSLWWAPLDLPASARRGPAVCLSPEERQRADRYHRPLDRRRFVAARGWLRHLLARQLLCAPSEVPIVTDDLGKPRIAGSNLRFSAAHSAGIALYATSWTMEVGVDIESIQATADVDRIAARFFTRAEQRALASLPPAQRRDASFRCWTRKEAYGKGIGTGLDFPLDTIDVWPADGRSATVSGWSVHQVAVPAGLAAAVAGADTDGWIPGIPDRVGGLDSEWLTPLTTTIVVPAGAAESRLHVH